MRYKGYSNIWFIPSHIHLKNTPFGTQLCVRSGMLQFCGKSHRKTIVSKEVFNIRAGWWFGTCFIFPYIGNVIIPTDEVIFFRWVGQPPTSRGMGTAQVAPFRKLTVVKPILPPGKHTKNWWENHHFSWDNSLFLWPFSIAVLVYQRVICFCLSQENILGWCFKREHMKPEDLMLLFSSQFSTFVWAIFPKTPTCVFFCSHLEWQSPTDYLLFLERWPDTAMILYYLYS